MQRDIGGESDIFNGGFIRLLVLMNMSFNTVYAEKNFLPIFLMLSGISMLARPVQPLKALSPISVTLLGIMARPSLIKLFQFIIAQRMPFSLLKKNTVFLIANAILKNFYLHLLDVIGGRVTGLDGAARLKALTTNVCHRTRKVDKIRSLGRAQLYTER